MKGTNATKGTNGHHVDEEEEDEDEDEDDKMSDMGELSDGDEFMGEMDD
jgi:ubiquitin-conjugating enzyme E2 H